MRRRAAAFGGAEARGGGEIGPISRRKSPSNGGPECRYDATSSLAAKHEIQALARSATRKAHATGPLPQTQSGVVAGRCVSAASTFACQRP